MNYLWISSKTIIELGNIRKASNFKNLLHLSYKSAQLVILWVWFLMRKILIDDFGCYTKIWIVRSLKFVEERIDSSILKLVYNGINKENMPANLKLELKKTILNIEK